MRRSHTCGILIVVVTGCFLGCSYFSGRRQGTGAVFESTEVGIPLGDKVTSEIGPAGGILTSADGRLTVTVPANAVTENSTFSVQPISNKSENAVGPGYRIEPSGKTFGAPVQLSFRYSDDDIAGTYPQALAVAYQDDRGAWREHPTPALDTVAKRVTISTTHLSDWSVFYGTAYRVTPGKATIHVGESLEIRTWKCDYLFFWYFFKPKIPCSGILGDFSLQGAGTLSASTVSPSRIIYTAPAKKPDPNVVAVSFRLSDTETDLIPAIFPDDMRTLQTKITIIDRGYRASGRIADMTYSGLICDLSKPFMIEGSVAGSINYKFDFMPTSGAAGAFTMSGGGRLGAGVFAGKAGGTYMVEGTDTDNPRIVMTGSGSGTGTAYGRTAFGAKSGTGTFELTPLSGNECGGEN